MVAEEIRKENNMKKKIGKWAGKSFSFALGDAYKKMTFNQSK